MNSGIQKQSLVLIVINSHMCYAVLNLAIDSSYIKACWLAQTLSVVAVMPNLVTCFCTNIESWCSMHNWHSSLSWTAQIFTHCKSWVRPTRCLQGESGQHKVKHKLHFLSFCPSSGKLTGLTRQATIVKEPAQLGNHALTLHQEMSGGDASDTQSIEKALDAHWQASRPSNICCVLKVDPGYTKL